MQKFGSSYPPTDSGHNWITAKAFQLLRRRKLLPASLDSAQQERRVQYGVTFADQPWLGRPEEPKGIVVNHMTREVVSFIVPGGTPIHWPMPEVVYHDATEDSARIGEVDAKVFAKVTWEASCEGCERPNVTPYFVIGIDVNGKAFPGIPRTAMDNMFHFPYGDLYRFAPNNPHEAFDLRLKITKRDILGPVSEGVYSNFWVTIMGPFQDIVLELSGASPEQITSDLIKALNNDRIVLGPSIGSVTYGAILYQLARKFFRGSKAEPSLDELIPRGTASASGHSGKVRGESPFDGLQMDFPATYLGGMPFICAPRPPPDPGPAVADSRARSMASNPCFYGYPTWPIWVPDSYSYDQRASFLRSLLRARPGRSDRVAAIYLGWAIHMVQDNALPYHAANWQGPEHERQELFRGYLPLGSEPADKTFYYDTKISNMRQVVVCSDGEPANVATVQYGLLPLFPAPPKCDQGVPYFISMDEFISTEVARRFGSKTRQEICASAGIVDAQIVSGRLNYQAVLSAFVEPARRSYEARLNPGPFMLKRVRDAVVSTMELLLCAPPGTLPGEPPGNCAKCNAGDRPRCGADGSTVETCQNTCWRPSTNCATTGNVCVDGACQAPPPSNCDKCNAGDPPRCSQDGRSVETCENTCWTRSTKCPTGRACVNGACQAQAPGQCTSPSVDCRNDQFCIRNRCVDGPRECRSHADCGSEALCVDITFKPNGQEVGTCALY